jgi:hypothetical protein
LQAGTERVEVELDDVGWGCYCVGGEEDVLLEEELLAYVLHMQVGIRRTVFGHTFAFMEKGQ